MSSRISKLLDWYIDMGIDMAVSDRPCNHFTFVPQAMPVLKPSPASRSSKGLSVSPQSMPPQPAMSHAVFPEGLSSFKGPASSSLPPTPSASGILPTSPLKMRKPPQSQKLAQACQSIEDLQQALLAWDECLLKMTATTTVFADGNRQAKVMIIGEAPGAEEDRQGLPFVGTCGQLLNNALATIGLNRMNTYITNIVPWRPPGNRPPTTVELAQCLPFVKRHIELIRPKLLILTGGVATKALLENNEGIMKLRGEWMSYQSEGLAESIRAMAVYHPAFLLRFPVQKAVLWQDLLVIQDEIKRIHGAV